MSNKLFIGKPNVSKGLCFLALLLCAAHPFAFARSATDISLSPNMQAVLLSKILLHEQSYRRQQRVNVFVLGEQTVALAFKQLIGKKAEYINIANVTSADALPIEKYDVVYFNDKKYLADAIAYGKKHGIVTMTGIPKLVEKGVTLGTGLEDGRTRFYLNLRTSFATDLEWDQKVLNIVKVYR